MSVVSRLNPTTWFGSKNEPIETAREEPLECRQCGGTTKIVSTKCPHCGFRGKMRRKEIRQASYGLFLVGLLVWPLLVIVPIMWIASWFASKRGVAPYEGMTRQQFLEEQDNSIF